MESTSKYAEDIQTYEEQLKGTPKGSDTCSRYVVFKHGSKRAFHLDDLEPMKIEIENFLGSRNKRLKSEVQELQYQNDVLKRVLRSIISTPNIDRLENQHLKAENEELQKECRVLREFIESRFRMPKLDIAGDFEPSDE